MPTYVTIKCKLIFALWRLNMKNRNRKKDILIFAVLLLIPAILLICGLVKNHIYNSATHTATLSEKELFSAEDSTKESLSFRAVSRDSSWTKAFDINGEGVEEDNYQAYTIDYYVSNNTKDEVKSFSFRLNFHDDAFLLSAWNGSLELHQHTAEGEIVDLVDDLRVFVPGDHKLLTYTDPVEGDTLVCMKPGDYLIYYPSSSQNAREMPIKPQEATVPDHILGKPGRLTDEEFEVIKSHTVRGGEIMSHFKSLENAGEGALYHHERYDGKGYPEGRKGEEIPFIARMICVADSFDAMNTNRVYRKKLTKEDILAELERCKGSQFDPKIADVMIELIKSDRLNVIEK